MTTCPPNVPDEPPAVDALEIALLNNLGDAGLEGGERQFTDLLRRAAGDRPLRIRFFSLPTIRRGASARARIAALYAPFDTLFERPLDGLIITGCEPRAEHLEEEVYWPSLCGVIDEARAATRSTIFSCLAAHAAVLHLDGIRRRPRETKLSGVYPVAARGPHSLLVGAPGAPRVPHSRWNGLDEAELVACGYDILTSGEATGVDVFAKDQGSLFVFLQGHPEYDPDALLREYRRDVLRYLERSSEIYPRIPDNVVSADVAAALAAFEQAARRERRLDAFARFPSLRRGDHTERSSNAFGDWLFSNWIDHLEKAPARHAA